MKLIEGEKGYFIASPCYEDNEGEYKDIVFQSKRAREWALKEVSIKYKEKKPKDKPEAVGPQEDDDRPFE